MSIKHSYKLHLTTTFNIFVFFFVKSKFYIYIYITFIYKGNAIHGISFRLAGLSAGKYSLFCIQQMYFVMSDGPCWETKYYIADLESFPFMSPIHVCTSVFKFMWSQKPGWLGLCWWGFLQTGQIRARQRDSGNIRHDSYSTESACRRGVACWRKQAVSKPDAASQHNRLSLSTGHLNFVSVCHK